MVASEKIHVPALCQWAERMQGAVMAQIVWERLDCVGRATAVYDSGQYIGLSEPPINA